ncbi:sugar transferase [uncultured Amaricoccus sp.]|uniref:sugar transferase n=1 Tax=uncultured Amaricoccus sp. TaxID=339341 RepID=UPI00262C806D|nr:sugar transferase [uncultured Amaricoccus sp.]
MAHYSEIEPGTAYTGVAGQGMVAAGGGANRRLSWRLKAVMDRVGAFVLLLMIAPLMAFIALAVRLDSPGPILFRQPRFGAGRSVVVVSKFRTMRPEGTDIGGRRQATRGDDRVTRVGRFLRKTCLDELPQIWDVLCGRMSLVGPRPHPLHLEVEGQPIESLIPDYHQRHAVRPGITGLAQIRGNRGPLENLAMGRERIRYDVEYIEGHSLWLDIRILFKTLVVPFQKDGSY